MKTYQRRYHFAPLRKSSKISNEYSRSSLEGQLKVVFSIFCGQRVVVELVRVEFMDQSTESQTTTKGPTEVCDIYSL